MDGRGRMGWGEEGAGGDTIHEHHDFHHEKGNRKNLIVNYLPQWFKETNLFALFVPFGPLKSVKVMCDRTTGYSFGFGFVNFLYEVDSDRAVSTLNGFEVGNKRLKVSFARPPSDEIKNTNLYISSLPKGMGEQELGHLFSPFGSIVQLKIIRDKHTRESKGTAFVRFSHRDESAAAIRALHDCLPIGAFRSISVRLAADHGKQRSFFFAGYKAAVAGVNVSTYSNLSTYSDYDSDGCGNYENVDIVLASRLEGTLNNSSLFPPQL